MDAFNQEIDKAEAFFVSLDIVESASVPFEDGTFLMFGKCGDKWRLLYENGSGDHVPLRSASKRLRIASARLLPALLAALYAAEATRLNQVTEAVDLIRSFLAEHA